MKLVQADLAKIELWMRRNARQLEMARWNVHFAGGPVTEVLEALTAYQNEDGGFGHALEPDCWNPHSAPLQTSTAVELLLELEVTDNRHPVVQGILKYLDSGADMDGDTWHNVIPSNNDYPHAPWWHTDSSSTARSHYNPSAILAGFILRVADRDSRLYERGLKIARELSESFLQNPDIERHPLKCLLILLESIRHSGLQQQFPYERLLAAAEERISRLLGNSAADWSGYSTRPSAFFETPNSIGYKANAALLERELDYILAGRNSDGVWDVTWSWEGYPQEFALSENWWKAVIAINNVLLLRAFGRLEE
ncbi:hypothetical protein [Paenibacillus tengchongensis]|uniref:hypothetical protein n=1 Tax=Paenibacillus tengchongensis TaxID=2608684 RepID=UPI00124E25E2|nr:hypothetical protein [Paenibacillus tengchongensis]